MSFSLISDSQIIDRIAAGCRKKRLLLNMTQAELAKRSNVSLRTIKKFENGGPASFRTVLSIMRGLGEIDRFQHLIPEFEESPKEVFLREQSAKPMRQRASGERD